MLRGTAAFDVQAIRLLFWNVDGIQFVREKLETI